MAAASRAAASRVGVGPSWSGGELEEEGVKPLSRSDGELGGENADGAVEPSSEPLSTVSLLAADACQDSWREFDSCAVSRNKDRVPLCRAALMQPSSV